MHVEVHHVQCAGLQCAGKMCWAAVCRQDVLCLYMEVKVTIRTVTDKY